MKTITRSAPVLCFLIALVCTATDPCCRRAFAAQQSEDSSASAPKDAEVVQKKPSDKKISDADRIVILNVAIEAEEKNLTILKKKLRSRQAAFDTVSGELKNVFTQREAKKKELQRLKGAETSAAAEKLKDEIKTLEEEMSLLRQRSDLAFQTLKNDQQQIEITEDRLLKDREVLDILKGIKTAPKAVPERAVTTAPPPAAGAEEPSAALPLPFPQPVEKKTEPEEAPANAQQIAARKEAQSMEAKALDAEQAIFKYVERKKILEAQIALEEKQLKTANDTYDNLDKTLRLQEQLLEEKIAAKVARAELLEIRKKIRSLRGDMKKIKADSLKQNDRLNDLRKHYEVILQEERVVMEEVQKKRIEADDARKKSVWLESPYHPRNILGWGAIHAPQLLLAVVMLVVLWFMAQLSARRLAGVMVKLGRGSAEDRASRSQTLSEAFKYVASLVIIVGGALLLLEAAGVDVKTLLGGAAVIGLTVAFGAQNLMRDYFSGFMILVEGQYKLNDIISIGEATGRVERMTMRTTVLRDLEGRAHFIPNGQIARVINRTHEWAQAVFNIRVSYREDVDRVMDILIELANGLRQDPKFIDAVTGEPEMLGVDVLDESAVVLKFTMRTLPNKMWPVRREMLRRIKNKFDEMGIKVPVPHSILMEK